MNKVFKGHLSLCAFTTAILFFLPNAGAEVETRAAEAKAVVSGKAQNDREQFSCNENASFYRCNDDKQHSIHGKIYQKTDKDNVEGAIIEASGYKTKITGWNITIKEDSNSGSSNKSSWKGVVARNFADVSIENAKIDFTNAVGVQAINAGSVYLTAGSITQTGGQVMNVNDSENSAFQLSKFSGHIRFNGGKVDVFNAHGISFPGVVGTINIFDSTVVVKGNTSYGIYLFDGKEHYNNEDLESYKRLGEGAEKKSAYVWGDAGLYEALLPREGVLKRGGVVLRGTSFTVPNSAAIYSKKSGGRVVLQKSTLSGDLLLKGEDNSFVKFVAEESSTLIGGAHIDESSDALFRLKDGSKWTLTRPKNESLQSSSSKGASSVSLVHLIDSSILFEKPDSSEAGNYQTLHIGRGTGVVYKAQGDAHLYLNTYLNEGGSKEKQRTDRLLVHGDVEGTTTVHVQGVSGSSGGSTGNGNNQGISIIQVSGTAGKDSFKLNGGYVTLNNSPYQYILRAYGPRSDLGEASSSQRLVEGNEAFWDFRLESQKVEPRVSGYNTAEKAGVDTSEAEVNNVPVPSQTLETASENTARSETVNNVYAETVSNVKNDEDNLEDYVKSGGFDANVVSRVGSYSHTERAVRSVVPQVPTYLTLPNSVFQAGLMDISNQNKQLERLRTTSSGMLGTHENPALYLYGYGGSYRYASDLSALEYGYGSDASYSGVEAGLLLQTIENADSAISFGVMGTYGKLSLQPRDVEQSKKSTFDKWTATAYGSLQHDTGFYVDGLLSYGLFKGDVFTLARGKTATLKANPLSVSLIGGQTLATGYEGFVFDPQVQVVYQHLQFNKARDIDGFDIEMGKLDQWVARVGGRLSKTLTVSEGGKPVSFYGKLYFAHGFGEKKSVNFKDAFQLGAFGSSLEAGLGFNAQLSQKFALHGDLAYQHKLTKAGFSGISFSGGVRYQF
ncbi:outer membrane autotransporter barrel domain-containing protein [Bartonella sp. DB5-6]|uniref:autotransporter outer membrane beta-barrel domain-containing protein n=1 Tax=Bartonella sp. DB5-6 TaxID=1094755 RepID=UPI00026E9A32|nr:autotransporter outer membrane beta-barrel domain-containing protein [Bartonella sp. DB5-6]EJF75948.1 outer membrane autotransporter barrel domain-containing protein [Bartonella sp. DB5-6]